MKFLNRFSKKQCSPRRGNVFVGLESLEAKTLMSTVQETTYGLLAPAATMASLTPGDEAAAPIASRVVVTAIPNVLVGKSVDLTASVQVADPAAAGLQGFDSPSKVPNLAGQSLTFMVDGVVVGTSPLVPVESTYSITGDTKLYYLSGPGTLATTRFSTPITTLGPHQITVAFAGVDASGDAAAVAPVTSDPITVTAVPIPETQAPVTIRITTDQSGSDLSGLTILPPDGGGAVVTIFGIVPKGTAHVWVYVVSDQVLPVGGTISLYDSDTLVGTMPVLQVDNGNIDSIDQPLDGTTPVTLNRGGAVFTINQAGQHSYRAFYSGDEAHLAATGTVVANFIPGDYVVKMSGPSQVGYGQPLMVDVTVDLEGLGIQDLTGVLTVDGYGTVALDASGHGSFTMTTLTPGPHQLSASYQIPDGPSGSTTVRTGILTSNYGLYVVVGDVNQQLVAQLYKDLLNREVEDAGLAHWTSLLNSGTSQESVVRQIMSTEEYHEALVQTFYRQILNRKAGDIEVALWAHQMDDGADPSTIGAAIMASDEFYKWDQPATGFINTVYNHLLNRDADDTAYLGWTDALAHGATRFDVIQAIMNTDEYRTVTANFFYNRYTRRSPDALGVAHWVDRLKQEPETLALAEFLGSAEYATVVPPLGSTYLLTHGLFGGNEFNYPLVSFEISFGLLL